MSTDTRHLDTAIAILKGGDGAKRAKRTVDFALALTLGEGRYSITVNGKEMEEGPIEGAPEAPEVQMHLRAARLRCMGKSVSTCVYGG